MKIIFMGTPDFAASSLKKLISSKHKILGVVCQSDKKSGRGHRLQAPPCKVLALEHNIPVFQPIKLVDEDFISSLKKSEPDLLVVVAYGRILPKEIIELPRLGSINLHASLLPKYRGAAPIQRAIYNGEKKTGVCTMYIAEDLDAGDVIYCEETDIYPDETAGELFHRLAEIGAELLIKTVDDIENGAAPRTPQDHSMSTYASMISKDEAMIDWNSSAWSIHCKIRAFDPWPLAATDVSNQTLKLYSPEILKKITSKNPGEIVAAGKQGIEFACKDGEVLLIKEIKAPGKRRMRAADWLLGNPIKIDEEK